MLYAREHAMVVGDNDDQFLNILLSNLEDYDSKECQSIQLNE